MPTQFAVPTAPKRDVLNIEYFRGVDLYNAPVGVDITRSPDAPNMIRDQVGKVRKRMGYETLHTFPARANGAYSLGDARLIHAGETLYERDGDAQGDPGLGTPAGWRVIREGLNDERSAAAQFSGALYIMDGRTYLKYDGTGAQPVSAGAYVPTVIIARAPTGGGTPYQPLNLLSRGWREDFLGTESATVYQLTAAGLDSDAVKAEVMQASGSWSTLTEGTGFTVNRASGRVTFTTAPGVSPVPGVDNVRITAYKTRAGYAGRINGCRVMALYGVGGSPDRIFAAGNPDYPNMDYHSEMGDPTYFGDTWYALVGQDDSAVMGYSVIANQLAAHKSPGGDGRSVVVREGRMDDGEAVFPVVNTLVGEGAVARRAFASIGSEPLYLTAMGVYAITTEELTGMRYGQHRSLYISKALQAERSPEDAFAHVWQDMYMLSLNGRVYVLDGLQKFYAKDEPYSSFQYECYVLHGIDARVMWQQPDENGDARLWFGTPGGRLCRFHVDVDSPASYSDDGRAIEAYWDTPDIDGDKFYKNKTFRYIAVRLASHVFTGVVIHARVRGIWRRIYQSGTKARYLDFNHIVFDKFTFSTDTTPRALGTKIKIKKVDKARFRMENAEQDEPFGIYSLALEFGERGNYKG